MVLMARTLVPLALALLFSPTFLLFPWLFDGWNTSLNTCSPWKNNRIALVYLIPPSLCFCAVGGTGGLALSTELMMGSDCSFSPQMNGYQGNCFCLFLVFFSLKCLITFSWQLGLPKVGLFEQMSTFFGNPWVRIHPSVFHHLVC